MRDHKAAAAERRAKLLEEIGTAAMTENWAKSTNPVKRRIGRLEVAWREALQWLMEDIKKMFQNFEVVSDAYDIVDVNIAAVKSLCIDKGVFTEAEFTARQQAIMRLLDAERERRQKELVALQAKQREEASRPAEDRVDPELVKMRDAAASTTDADHVPAAASIL